MGWGLGQQTHARKSEAEAARRGQRGAAAVVGGSGGESAGHDAPLGGHADRQGRAGRHRVDSGRAVT